MPTLNDVRKLQGLIKNASDTEYVFSKLRSADWIPLLLQEGLFSSPYEPKPEGNGMLFPAWPQSRFLARLAREEQSRQNQEVILAAALQIPETSNVRVHEDLVDVALGIDTDLSAKLVPTAVEWVRSPYQLRLPSKLGALISRLARGGLAHSALLLAESVLEVTGDRRQEGRAAAESPFRNLREATARFNLWEYEQILTKNVPDLVDATGKQALELLCDLLDRAILLSDRRGAERRPDDLSHIWRPAIEEHVQNVNMGVKHLLATAVRNAAEQIAGENTNSVRSVVEALEKRGESWLVFRRIALHLLRVVSDPAPTLVRERLLNRALFDSVEMRHEYFLLEKECFGRLTGDDQKVILGWIDQGPTYTDAQLKTWEEFTGRTWTADDRKRYIRQWKRDHLAPLQEHLEATWKEAYAKLLSQEGRPEHPEFTSYHEGGTWGPQSPESHEELAKMSPNDLVTYLANWKPAGGWFRGASPEGLGREVTALVSENPETYAAAASEFKRLSEPTYVRAVIQGLQNALKQKRKFEWSSVLALCVWAVAQTRDIPGRSVEHFEMDSHWGWTRAAIARLLTDGFLSDENPLRFEAREDVWRAIEPLTGDPDPTPEQEEKYVKGGVEEEYRKRGLNVRGLDPLTNAINSVRGVAMLAVVQYALWVRRGLKKSENRDALLAQGFGAMPEVRKVLDVHLARGIEPSITIRAIYGQRLPWLQLLDRKWAEDNTARLLPRNEPEFWHAAWDTYVCYCAPYDDVFDWLKDEYAFAVEQIGTHQGESRMPQAPDYSLAQHLMTYYWRGKLDYQGGILDAFYRRADAKLCGHALNFVGRSLRDTKEPIPNQISERLKELWTKRVEVAKQQPGPSAEELKEYGWWFASGKFNGEWSINQLLEALRLARWAEPDHLVLERLAEMSQAMPLQCIQALTMIVDGDTKGWAILGWQDKAKDIIRAARKSRNPDARRVAEDLVNLLGSRGHFDFGELLKESIE